MRKGSADVLNLWRQPWEREMYHESGGLLCRPDRRRGR